MSRRRGRKLSQTGQALLQLVDGVSGTIAGGASAPISGGGVNTAVLSVEPAADTKGITAKGGRCSLASRRERQQRAPGVMWPKVGAPGFASQVAVSVRAMLRARAALLASG
jgi:hypothetical protein